MKQYLNELSKLLTTVNDRDLNIAGDMLMKSYLSDGTIYVIGNGGSAATASHFACDLMKWTNTGGIARVRAISLTDNVPLMTAWSNDLSYDYVFMQQLVNLQRPGDIVFAISCSGNSPSIIKCIEWTNISRMPSIGLCGFEGGMLSKMATHSIIVNSQSMPQIEDVHSAICHSLAVWMKNEFMSWMHK